jgi:hypothetical protein
MPEKHDTDDIAGLFAAIDDRALSKAANSKVAAQCAHLLGGKSGEAFHRGQIEPQFPGGARVTILWKLGVEDLGRGFS